MSEQLSFDDVATEGQETLKSEEKVEETAAAEATNNTSDAQDDEANADRAEQEQFESVAERHGQKTLEEQEEALFKERAILYRLDPEERAWKERGTGVVKILKHGETQRIRLLMRREKTLKICANHYILPELSLRANSGNDRSWVWSTLADFADETPKKEMLAIKFTCVEHAKAFQTVFDAARDHMKTVAVGFVEAPDFDDAAVAAESSEADKPAETDEKPAEVGPAGEETA
jgi:Ran-binding protein 1